MSRLLKQLALAKLTAMDIDQLAGVRLSYPKRIDTGRFGSMVTLDLFSKLLRDLRLLFTVPRSEERDLLRDRLQDDPKRSAFVDDRFYDLFYLVADAMAKMRGLAIDNAQHVDDITLERVMELWEILEYRFGILLCAQQQPNETVKERVQRMLGTIPVAKRGASESEKRGTLRAAKSCLDVIELPRIDDTVFYNSVFDPWLKAMNAELSPKLASSRPEFIAKACLLTAGDWIRLTSLTTDLTRELDTQNRNPRLISEEIANRVFERRMKILGMLGVQ